MKHVVHLANLIGVFGILFSFSQGALASDNKRLAFSKKAGIEVLAQGKNWCSENAKIELKVQNDAFFSSDQASKFIQKVGAAVLPVECPQANRISVTGISSGNDKVIFNGSAAKSDSWALVADRTKTNSAFSEKAETTKVSESEKQSTVSSVREELEESTKAATESNQNVMADANVSKAKQTIQAIVKSVDEDIKESDVLAQHDLANSQGPEQAQEANVASENDTATSKTSEKKAANFSVGGYKPKINSVHFSNPEKNAVTVTTLDRCKIYNLHRRLSQDWLAFPKDGFNCVDGNLEGQGIVEFKNLDAVSKGNIEGTLISGHFFENIPKGWQPQQFVESGGTFSKRYSAIFHISSNPALKTHFIGVMTASRAKFDRHTVYALTDHDVLMNPELAEQVVKELAEVQKKQGYKGWDLRTIYVYESLDDFKNGIVGLKATRAYVQGATYEIANHVIAREEKRLAEIERKKEAALLQKIMREREMEAEYIAYQQLPIDELKRRVLGNYVFSFTDSDYLKAAEGALELRRHRSRWMVHIDDIGDEKVEIDFPIEMYGISKEFKDDGWYVVEADLSGVIGKTNDSGYIQPELANIAIKHHCKTEKCNEFSDPLTVIRTINKMPEWLPSEQKD